MIDIHTHILPGIDDGSKNPEMSVEMLSSLKEEGVTDVVLTPHFYPSQNSVERFLERRRASFENLMEELEGRSLGLRLHLGAEILFMDSLDRVDGLGEMALGNTKYILLEMPFTKWSRRNLDTVYKVICNGYNPIIAHFERYIGFNGGLDEMRELKSMGCLLQMNASNFNGFFNRRRAVKYFGDHLASLLGSDTHNLDSRPPKIKFAYDIVREKLGDRGVERILYRGGQALEKSDWVEV